MLGVVALARLIPVITGLLLFAVGLDLTGADLRRVREEPRLLLAGRLAPPLLRAPLALGALVRAVDHPPPSGQVEIVDVAAIQRRQSAPY
jgi:hypothetical protein